MSALKQRTCRVLALTAAQAGLVMSSLITALLLCSARLPKATLSAEIVNMGLNVHRNHKAY